MIKYIFPLIFLCVLNMGCKKNTGDTIRQKDVYIAGNIYLTPRPITPDYVGDNVAVYWKNGMPNYVADRDNSSSANGIAVHGDDVYIVGYNYKRYNGNGIASTLWKNCVPLLTVSNAMFYGVTVNNNDVYIVGYYNYKATLWKNGERITLNAADSRASAIVIQGNDVYIAGYIYHPEFGLTACYWKNGKEILLTGKGEFAKATAIAVNGNDVYVAGLLTIDDGRQFPVYWKNGEHVKMPLNTKAGKMVYDHVAIDVEGNDVYMVGKGRDEKRESPEKPYWYALYWKNGVVINRTTFSNNKGAEAIFIDGKDMYVTYDWSAGDIYYLKNYDKKELDINGGHYGAECNAIYVEDSK